MYLVLKIIGAILIVFAGFMAGNSFSKKLHERKNFLKAFIVFLTNLSTQLRYNSSDIFTLINTSNQISELQFFDFEDIEPNQPFSKLWKTKIRALPKSLSLTKTDIEMLIEFGSELGKTDIDGQLTHIELYKTVFEKQLSDAESAIGQKSKLYKTMGFFAGTATALMII